jgi:3-phytase
VKSFTPAGEINNVDLRDNVVWRGQSIILVGASNRNDRGHPAVNLYALDAASGGLSLLASLPVGATGEAYGFCFGRVRGEVLPHAYVVLKDGRVLELALNDGGAGNTPNAGVVRSFAVASQAEGCVVDDRTGQLYLGEEDQGIWRIDLRAQEADPIEYAWLGATHGLVADVEGLALAPAGATGGYLVASSQGDNAYAILDLESGTLKGRFRLGAGGETTSDTDGIELILGDFGPRYRQGLLVIQDGDNAPDAQNFKLVDWQSVRTALGL